MQKPSLLVIVGPTASGKTALAIECAKEFIATYNENIINPYKPLEDVLEKSFLKDLSFTGDEYNKTLKEIIAYLTWYSFGKA